MRLCLSFSPLCRQTPTATTHTSIVCSFLNSLPTKISNRTLTPLCLSKEGTPQGRRRTRTKEIVLTFTLSKLTKRRTTNSRSTPQRASLKPPTTKTNYLYILKLLRPIHYYEQTAGKMLLSPLNLCKLCKANLQADSNAIAACQN